MKNSKSSTGKQFWIFTIPAMFLNLFFDSAHYPIFNTVVSFAFAIYLITWYKGIKVSKVA